MFARLTRGMVVAVVREQDRRQPAAPHSDESATPRAAAAVVATVAPEAAAVPVIVVSPATSAATNSSVTGLPLLPLTAPGEPEAATTEATARDEVRGSEAASEPEAEPMLSVATLSTQGYIPDVETEQEEVEAETETQELKESHPLELQELWELQPPEEVQEPRELQAPEEAQEPPELHGLRELTEPQDLHELRELRGPLPLQEPREFRVPKEPTEAQEIQQHTRELQESRELQELQEFQQPRKPREHQESVCWDWDESSEVEDEGDAAEWVADSGMASMFLHLVIQGMSEAETAPDIGDPTDDQDEETAQGSHDAMVDFSRLFEDTERAQGSHDQQHQEEPQAVMVTLASLLGEELSPAALEVTEENFAVGTDVQAEHVEREHQRKALVATFLKDHGYSDVKAPKRTMLKTKYPIHTAAKQGDLQMVKMLLEEGADPTKKTSWGKTAIQIAKAKDKRGSHAAVLRALGGA
mmetsp:Transcript_107860/g.300751  ORF Transcript_107860/g.300751 Transcript_107860/m.300751 type:complete len:471 (-) Transcript_107860:217-1629(-)